MSRSKFIIFGASGDLARKKLYPALFDLYLNGLKYDQYVGFGRTKFSQAEFIDTVKKSLVDKKNSHQEKFNDFLKLFIYVNGAYDKSGIADLKSQLSDCQPTYYLAIPTSFKLIGDILAGLQVDKLITKESKIVLEKPFGNNFISAIKLNKLLLVYFKEQQIYRIDHYLAKDLVRDLLTLRFTNSIFEPLWNNKYIESISIQIKETGDIGERGEFYDQTGAIRDVIQNHAIQLLALTLMDQPKDLSPKSIHEEKLKVLNKLRLFGGENFSNIKIGQYLGYKKNRHIKDNSLTETSASLKAEFNSSRWRGVPITLLTGKMLNEQSTDIIIKFKSPKAHPWQNNGCHLESNQLQINIQPRNDIRLRLNFGFEPAKTCTLPIDLRFGFLDNQFMFKDAYENALKDLYLGDQSIFLSSKEILLAWKFIDSVMIQIDKNRRKLLKYY